MCTRHNCPTAIQMWRWVRIIKGCRLRIQFHVPRIDSRTVHPMSTVRLSGYRQVKGRLTHQGLLRLSSPASINNTCRWWSKLASRPATTQPALPPPQTMISTSSGIVILIGFSRILLQRIEIGHQFWEFLGIKHVVLYPERHGISPAGLGAFEGYSPPFQEPRSSHLASCMRGLDMPLCGVILKLVHTLEN